MAVFILFSHGAQASNLFICDLTARISEVQSLARLGGSATFRRGMDDFDQRVMLVIKSIDANEEGLNGCRFRVGESIPLSVIKENVGKHQVNDILKLRYTNFGDASGSRINWTLLKDDGL